MVYFVCNICGENLKKNQVEKHFYTCRKFHVSCVDCNKDFIGRYAYITHTNCISEQEKYTGKLYKGNPNFAEAKKNLRMANLNRAAQNLKDSEVKRLLNKLMMFDNIPKQEKKFQNFAQTTAREYSNAIIQSAWQVINETQNKMTSEPTQKNNEDEDNKHGNVIPPKQDKNKSNTEIEAVEGTMQPIDHIILLQSGSSIGSIGTRKIKKSEVTIENPSELHVSGSSGKRKIKKLEKPSLENLPEHEISNDTAEKHSKTKRHKDTNKNCASLNTDVAANDENSGSVNSEISSKKKKHHKEKSPRTKSQPGIANEVITNELTIPENKKNEHNSDGERGLTEINNTSLSKKLHRKVKKPSTANEPVSEEVQIDVKKIKTRSQIKHQKKTKKRTYADESMTSSDESRNQRADANNINGAGIVEKKHKRRHKKRTSIDDKFLPALSKALTNIKVTGDLNNSVYDKPLDHVETALGVTNELVILKAAPENKSVIVKTSPESSKQISAESSHKSKSERKRKHRNELDVIENGESKKAGIVCEKENVDENKKKKRKVDMVDVGCPPDDSKTKLKRVKKKSEEVEVDEEDASRAKRKDAENVNSDESKHKRRKSENTQYKLTKDVSAKLSNMVIMEGSPANTKFKWSETAISIMEANQVKEMSFKKLRKQIFSRYKESSGELSKDKAYKKIEKRLNGSKFKITNGKVEIIAKK